MSGFRKAEKRGIKGFTTDDEGQWTGSYSFVHLCDPQFGFISVKKAGDGLTWEEDVALTNRAIEAVNNMKPRPRFIFVNGDLAHALPDSGPHKQKQENDLLKCLDNSEIPVFVTSGNHDIGITPTHSTVTNVKSKFGNDYYTFYVGGVLYIALNSQFFFDSSRVEDLAEEQLKWLKEILERAKHDNVVHVIVFMHIPLFTSDPDEDDAGSNIPKERRMQLLQDFADAGVELVLSGHYHRNGGGSWTRFTEDGKMQKVEVIVDSSIGVQLGTDQSGIGIVFVGKNKIDHRYYALEEIPQNIELTSD